MDGYFSCRFMPHTQSKAVKGAEMPDPFLDRILHFDEDSCAREPIHHISHIQPHGYLFGLHASTLALVTKSENLAQLNDPHQFVSYLQDTLGEKLLQIESESNLSVEFPNHGNLRLHCFRSGDVIFCEFDSVPENNTPAENLSLIHTLEETSKLIEKHTDLASLCCHIARTIRDISGFERVLIYRFDEKNNGEVIGESLANDWQQSFIGLHFPASDIPPQARALYLRTQDRWMPTCNYLPIPLTPMLDVNEQPFDLSLSHYRSVSPAHRVYQRNIGADGAMSISIKQAGRLWGLIIGHHRLPHRVSTAAKNATRTLANLFSIAITAIETTATLKRIDEEDRTHFKILEALATSSDVFSSLTECNPNIGDLFPGCLGVAMVWRGPGSENIRKKGNVLPDGDLIKLANWVRKSCTQTVYATNHLSGVQPWVAEVNHDVAGLLAGSFDDDSEPVLLVLRKEQIKTVDWAGKPEKTIGPDGKLSLPRRSFERWQEVLRGYSAPWSEWELTIATDIINAINRVILYQSHRLKDMKLAYQDAIELSRIDGLTRLANRRYFDECLLHHLELAKRAHYPIGLLLIDIDDFKPFNDHYGHVAGDQCLIRVSQAISMLVKRLPDLVARYGGEEIILLLPNADLEGIRKIGLRALQAIRDLSIAHAFSRVCNIVTVSIGGISFTPNAETGVDDLIRMVDEQLYMSKNAGRNRISL